LLEANNEHEPVTSTFWSTRSLSRKLYKDAHLVLTQRRSWSRGTSVSSQHEVKKA